MGRRCSHARLVPLDLLALDPVTAAFLGCLAAQPGIRGRLLRGLQAFALAVLED